jgi:hypothetical protein
MVKVNCLETTKKNYPDLRKDDIEEMFKKINMRARVAQNAGENVAEVVQKFTKELVKENEYKNKQKLLRDIYSAQSKVNMHKMVQNFLDVGTKNDVAVRRALESMIHGSTWKAAGNRDSAATKKMAAQIRFMGEFEKDMGNLMPLFLSNEGQIDLANALFERKKGSIVEGDYGKMADVILKYYMKVNQTLEQLGIPVVERLDRITPNVHLVDKLTGLTGKEKKEAKRLYGEDPRFKGDPDYEYAFQKWNSAILPLIDHDAVFTEHGFDKNDPAQVEAFQRKSFDELTNVGKASQDPINFVEKFQKPRVYIWKDGKSLVDYNNLYGSESIQDSIKKELVNSFRYIEVIKDFGTTPEKTMLEFLKEVDKDPAINQRFNKAEEKQILITKMRDLTSDPAQFRGLTADITNALLVFEVATKLGNVVPSSFGDLANTARVAREAGMGQLESMFNVLKNFTVGLSKEDQEILYQTVLTGQAAKLGQMSRYLNNAYQPRAWMSKLGHYTMRWNMLEWWDNANKAEASSVIARGLARHREFSWEQLPDQVRSTYQSYNIDAIDWDVIRSSAVKIGKKKQEFIAPDSVRSFKDDMVMSALQRKGIKPTPAKIAEYKDLLERKLLTYFRDGQAHSIVSPDAVESRALSLGIDPSLLKGVPYGVLKIATQFKSFDIANIRRQWLSTFRAGGATTNLEAFNPLSGKHNWQGMGALFVKMMFFAYISDTMINLSNGLGPNDPSKLGTWEKMITRALGIFGRLGQFDVANIMGSAGKYLDNPVLSDLDKTGKLIYNLYQEHRKGMGYKKSKKAGLNLLRGSIPFPNPLTKWAFNHFWLSELEEQANPGMRQKRLNKIQKDTGATQLF